MKVKGMKKLNYEKGCTIKNIARHDIEERPNLIKTVAVYSSVVDVINNLVDTGRSETIQLDVKTYLERYFKTIKTSSHGIGWVFTVI